MYTTWNHCEQSASLALKVEVQLNPRANIPYIPVLSSSGYIILSFDFPLISNNSTEHTLSSHCNIWNKGFNYMNLGPNSSLCFRCTGGPPNPCSGTAH